MIIILELAELVIINFIKYFLFVVVLFIDDCTFSFTPLLMMLIMYVVVGGVRPSSFFLKEQDRRRLDSTSMNIRYFVLLVT